MNPADAPKEDVAPHPFRSMHGTDSCWECTDGAAAEVHLMPSPAAAGEVWASNGSPRHRVTLREKGSGLWYVCADGEVDAKDGWIHDGGCCWVSDVWLSGAHVVHYGPEEGIDCCFCDCRHERREFACND